MPKNLHLPKRIQNHLLLITLALFAAAGWANGDTSQTEALRPYTASYTLKTKGMTIANITYQLQVQGKQLLFSSKAEPKGLAKLISYQAIIEHVVLEINHEQLRPLQYKRQHGDTNNGKVENLQVIYDWKLGTATIKSNGSNLTIDLEGGLWDEASIQLAIMHDLQQESVSLFYRVIDNPEIKEHHYQTEGKETIKTKIGQYTTLKVVRKHGKRQTIMWFAPELNYLLVKTQRYKEGKLKSEMLLQSAKLD
jgi:hypothetical protein